MSENKYFEKLLSKAFCAYAAEEFGNVPTDGDEYPMPKSELKWAKEQDRMRKYGRPMWQVHLRRCAAAVLVLFSVSAAVLASSVEVRAAVREFFSEWFNSFINIFYAEEEETDGDIYLYDVTYVPSGFEESEKLENENLRRYVYTLGESRLTVEIAFTKYATVSADSEANGYEEVWLGSHSAYVLYDSESGSGAVIFGDCDITVSAEGNISREELIRVAKGINTDEADILGYVRKFNGHTENLPNIATYMYNTSISDFSYENESTLETPVTVGFKIPETWCSTGANSCEKLLPDLSGYQIASGSSVVLYEVDPDFVLDCKFHETQEHKYAISFYMFEGKKVSEYRTAKGFDSVIYYQYDDADDLYLTAFIRLTDTMIMLLDLNGDSNNAAQLLDILDTVQIGEYDEPEKNEAEPIRFNFDKLTEKEQKYYLMLENGEITEDMVFTGEDAKALRTAVKLYRINTQYDRLRYGSYLYCAYLPDPSKNEVAVYRDTAESETDEITDLYNEKLYDLKIDVLMSRISEHRSETDKVRAIAEFLYDNVIHTCAADGGEYESTPISAIYSSRADCIGLAYAFETLCKSAGIEVTTVYAHGVSGHYATDGYQIHEHNWNMVKIDGKWYHIDLALMKADRESEDAFEKYFLISDSEIKTLNGDFSLMQYGDEIESPAFDLPEAPESYYSSTKGD